MKALVKASQLVAVVALAGTTSFAGAVRLTESLGVARDVATRTCELEATEAGFNVGASGLVQLTSSNRGDTVGVKVEAKLEDKTLLIISAGTADGRGGDVGSLYMFMGVGTFQAGTYKDPLIFPVDQIDTVSVRLGDEMLLKGHCPTSAARQN